MQHNPLRSRPPFIIAPRPNGPTKAEKVAIWNAQNGLCPACGKPVAMEGLGVEYDHHIPRAISGDDSLGNLFALHRACHAEKTNQHDKARIAKTMRQEKMTRPKVEKASGFRKHPTLYRGVDGQLKERRK